jgi:aspartate racemase
MKVIGILGGSSDQATADYYRLLNQGVREAKGGWNTAEIIVNSLNFAKSERWVREGRWDEAGESLKARARGLEAAGAELLICCSNTLHRVADVFTDGLRIPFLHIVDPTAEAIRAAKLARVALLGTRPVMATDFLKRRYQDRFGIEILVPEEAEQAMVDRVIFDELCKGRFTPESRGAYLRLIDELQGRGAQGVILGCTEIPLLVKQSDRPGFPLFDTTALHVAATVRRALAD